MPPRVTSGTSLQAEYLVKKRGFSLFRAEWLSREAIEADGRLSKNSLARFLRRVSDGEPVDASYKAQMLPERVISCEFV